jgi:hypothetical protein
MTGIAKASWRVLQAMPKTSRILFALFLLCVVGATLAATGLAADNTTDPAFQGYKLAFAAGQEYQKVADGTGSATAFNAAVDAWNAFVRQFYGENAGLLMTPMSAANADTTKPVAIGKNITNNGIVHAIDGSGKWGPSWTTNDVNAMSDSAIKAYHNQDSQIDPTTGKPVAGAGMGDGYLGGV